MIHYMEYSDVVSSAQNLPPVAITALFLAILNQLITDFQRMLERIYTVLTITLLINLMSLYINESEIKCIYNRESLSN